MLAEITKSERTVTRLLHGMPEAAHELRNEIDALANTARQMHTALNRAWWVLLTISFVGGAGGAVTVLLLSEWIGSPSAEPERPHGPAGVAAGVGRLARTGRLSGSPPRLEADRPNRGGPSTVNPQLPRVRTARGAARSTVPPRADSNLPAPFWSGLY